MQGLDEISPVAAELEQSNMLALAIVAPGSFGVLLCSLFSGKNGKETTLPTTLLK